MKKPNFFQSGFSIMEVMIAAALLGVVSVGVLNVTKNMTKASKADAQRVEFAQVTNQVQSILRDEYSCEASLMGLSPQGAGSPVTALKRKKPDGSTADVFTSGISYGTGAVPIFLQKMEIRNYNASSGIAEFVITMNKGRKHFNSMTTEEKQTITATAYGSPTVAQKLKVHVLLDASGKIKDCLSDKDDYTAGSCAMVDGDWGDKVKCKSINVQGNGTEPSITAETNLHVKSGLNVGSTLSGDPGDGNANFLKNIDVRDMATVKNNTTITTGKLIFNDGDASIAQVAGSNLYVQNKAGTGNANLIVGRTGNPRTTITPTSVTVNKNGTIVSFLALEVNGNALITGSGPEVFLGIGNGEIVYDRTNLVLRKPGGGVVQYRDGSTIEEIATKGFVNAQLGRALTGDPATLSVLLSNLSSLVAGSPLLAISASVCGYYTNMVWNGTRCVDNRNTDCPADQMMVGFNNGLPQCIPYVRPNQSCPIGQLWTGIDSNGTRVCTNTDTQIGGYVDEKIAVLQAETNAQTLCQNKGPEGRFTRGHFSLPERCSMGGVFSTNQSFCQLVGTWYGAYSYTGPLGYCTWKETRVYEYLLSCNTNCNCQPPSWHHARGSYCASRVCYDSYCRENHRRTNYCAVNPNGLTCMATQHGSWTAF